MIFDMVEETPTQQLIRRRRLREWTGWSNEYIAQLVEEGRLLTWRLHPNNKPMYFTKSAEEIMHGKR
jgi:hypothetical protein